MTESRASPTVTESRRLIFNSVTLNQKDINQIGEIIEKIPDLSFIEYSYSSKNKRITTNSLEAFLDISWPDNILTLEMEGKSDQCSLLISLDTFAKDANEESEITITGHNSILVNGILSQINDIFDSNKNYHFLAFSKLLSIFHLFTLFILFYSIWPFIKIYLNQLATGSFMWILTLVLYSYMLTRKHFNRFFKWLFPYTFLEVGNYSMRKRIKYFVVIVILPFLINLLYDIFTNNVKLYPL